MKNNKEVCTLILEHLVERLVTIKGLNQETVVRIVRNNMGYMLKVIDDESDRIYHLRKRIKLQLIALVLILVVVVVITKNVLFSLFLLILIESLINGSLRLLRDEITVKYIVPNIKIKNLCKLNNRRFKVIVIGYSKSGVITIMNIDDKRIEKLYNPKIYISNKETLFTFILKYINESKCDLESILNSLESFVLACYYSI